MGINNRGYDHFCWVFVLLGMVTFPPKTKSIIMPKTPFGGNLPMIVQLPCHTIKSTTAQTIENAENAEISHGWYVAALKIVPAHGRGVSCPSPLCTPERSECTPPLSTKPWAMDFDCTAPLWCVTVDCILGTENGSFGDQNSRTWLGLSSSSSALLLIAGVSAGGWHETK